MSRPAFQINKWSDIPDAISKMQAAGAGYRVPLMQALYHGRIAHFEVQRTGSTGLMKRWMAAIDKPGLLLIGDDDHATPAGPATWPLTERAMGWARFVLLHGAAGYPEHYSLAVSLTERYGRLVMVECASINLPAWRAAAERWGRRSEGQIITPAPGLTHPSLAAEPIH